MGPLVSIIFIFLEVLFEQFWVNEVPLKAEETDVARNEVADCPCTIEVQGEVSPAILDHGDYQADDGAEGRQAK